MHRAMLCAVLCALPAAAQTTIVVPLDQPTIQAAVDVAVAGDVIEIRTGIYTEAVTLTGESDLTLRGKGKVILRSSLESTGITLDTCTNVHLEKLGFDGPGVGVEADGGSDLVVEACRFDGLDTAFLAISPDGDTTVRDSVFRNIRQEAIAIFSQEDGALGTVADNRVRGAQVGIFVSGGRCLVTGNDVRRIARDGIVINSPDFAAEADSLVQGNRVEDVGQVGIHGQTVPMDTATLTLLDNVVRRAPLGGILMETPRNTVLDGNQVRLAGLFGIGIVFSDDVITLVANDVRKVLGDGLVVESGLGQYTLTKNLVLGAGHDGLSVEPDGTLIDGNVLLDSDRFGADLGGEGATLTQNTIQGSGAADLHEDNPGSNDIQPDNDIGTTDP